MLIQTPSKIFKSDFAVWKNQNSCRIREILTEEEDLNLRKVTEIVFDEDGKFRYQYKANCSLMILVLYGEIVINDFKKQISAHEVFTLKSTETDFLTLKNNLEDEKADVLIIELESKRLDYSFLIKDLNIDLRNCFIQISEDFDYPNFIGLYDGRKEDTYVFYKPQKSVFGMVINGAFEFQNRLLETRDAVLLSEIETLEFEALSENALILFFRNLKKFTLKSNQFNTFRKETIFPIHLDEKSAVSIDLFETDGRKIFSVINHQDLSAGKKEVKISGNQLNSGKYTAKITIENSKGEFIENIEVTVH